MKRKIILLMITVGSLIGIESCEVAMAQDTDNDEGKRDKEYYDIMIKPYGNKVFGYYNFDAKAYEKPSNEVLPIIDRKYFKYTVTNFITEVDNLPPSATYEISLNENGKHKIDLIYLDGCNKTNASAWNKYKGDLETMLKMPQHNLDIKTYNVRAYAGDIENKSELAWNDWGINGTWTNIDKDYLISMSSGWWGSGTSSITGNLAKIKEILSIQFDDMVSKALEGHSFSNEISIDFEATNLIPADGTEEERSKKFTGSYTTVLNGEVMKTHGVDRNRGYISDTIGWLIGRYDKGNWNISLEGKAYNENTISAAVNYADGEGLTSVGVSMSWNLRIWEEWQEDHRVNRDLNITLSNNDMDKIKQQLRPGSTRIYIYDGDVLTDIQSEKGKAYIWNYFNVNEKSYLVSIAGNIDDLKELDNTLITPYDGPGSTSVAELKLNEPAEKQKVVDFILSKVPIRNKNTDWYLLGDEIVYKTFYDDIEHDVPLNFLNPKEIYETSIDSKLATMWNIAIQILYKQDKILAEKWRYKHTPDYYDNGMGIVTFSGSWIENPMHTLDKVGLYRINYKRKDNPLYKDVDTESIFKNYRYWSTDYDERVAGN